MRVEWLPLRPLVVNPLGLAKRAFQGVGCDRLDLGGDADGVLDVDADPLGMIDKPAAVPALRTGFGRDGQFIHSPVAGELHDKMAAAPVGRMDELTITAEA